MLQVSFADPLDPVLVALLNSRPYGLSTKMILKELRNLDKNDMTTKSEINKRLYTLLGMGVIKRDQREAAPLWRITSA